MKRLLLIIFLLVLAITYLPLLLHSSSAGDTTYVFKSMFQDYPLLPYAWHWSVNSGLGGFSSPFTTSQILTFFISILGNAFPFSWEIIQRIVFIIPFIVLSFIGSSLLGRKILHSKEFGWTVTVVFMINTYVLMLLSGGQYVVALAYSLVPLLIYLFIGYLESLEWKQTLLFAVAFGIEIMLDLRFAYMTSVILALLFLYFLIIDLNIFKKKFIFLAISLACSALVIVLMQMFWLLPTMLHRGNPLAQLGSAYTTDQAVSYFSFAKFENAISLLHPNWPENIFGKVGFMKPEFLLLPILAYASLLLFRRKKVETGEEKYIIYFALLGLLGAFLAKGANDPSGGIYLWMFDHVPGFIMFRDSSKWYTLVAISYAVLIPFSFTKIYEWLKFHQKFSIFNFQLPIESIIFNLQNIFLLFAICCLLFPLRPALLWQLTGTFKSVPVPADYQKLEQFLSEQHQFSRTLWIPTTQRFVYSSSFHPAISARDYFNAFDNKKLLAIINNKQTLNHLQEIGVKYIIIPYDSEKEIFLSDRKYDSTVRTSLDKQIAGISELKRVSGFGMIDVFSLPNPKEHFWSTSNFNITYQQVNPTKYTVELANARKGEKLIFSESYDSNWVAKSSTTTTQSTVSEGSLNSFTLPKNGNYTLEISFTPQKWVTVGLYISLGTLVVLFALEAYLIIRDKRSLQK